MLKNFFSWLEPLFDENGNGGYSACGGEVVTKIEMLGGASVVVNQILPLFGLTIKWNKTELKERKANRPMVLNV
jgi:hypothetical protein